MLNKAQIIGRLGKDPEIRVTQTGTPIASLTVATTEKWKDKAGVAQETTEWHKVSLFGKLAEVAEKYMSKGTLVYIEGKIQTRKYTDKQGVDKYATEIHGLELKLLGGKGDNQATAQNGVTATPSTPSGSVNLSDIDDDLPF